MKKDTISILWLRRDFRFDDNKALIEACKSKYKILPVFIFDNAILSPFKNKKNAQILFILEALKELNCTLQKECNCSIEIAMDSPLNFFKSILKLYDVKAIFANEDYEFYAQNRDAVIADFCKLNAIEFKLCKDSVIFAKREILKANKTPYTLFAPYKKNWLNLYNSTKIDCEKSPVNFGKFYKSKKAFWLPSQRDLDFVEFNDISILPKLNIDNFLIENYCQANSLKENATTRLGVYLRFGSISIRKLFSIAMRLNSEFASELIWREFFMQLLFNFPKISDEMPFKDEYKNIEWINNLEDFERWKNASTNIDIVDAAMNQLNSEHFMPNRARMICASYLCKNLLIDWRLGEKYFAEQLIDFEFASNNGNWQWCASCGAESNPYFRVFNPYLQAKRFDKDFSYTKKWLNRDLKSEEISLDKSRKRAILTFAKALKKSKN